MPAALRAALERFLGAMWFASPAGAGARLTAALLSPLAALTARVATRRRRRVRRLAPDARPAVLIIGNLVVGGTGKTPATVAVARALAARGWQVGVLCAGYRGERRHARIVTPDSDPRQDGDEAVLLAQQTGLAVAAGRARADALALLRTQRPELEVVVCDDGLQHAALARTLEVAVFDARGAGNGRLLPAGPLREPLQRAGELDAILLNGVDVLASEVPTSPAQRRFRFDLRAGSLRALRSGTALEPASFVERFAAKRVAALAGIGHPERFFNTLAAFGLRFERHAPGDHARLAADTLAAIHADAIVMTSKDAVKCAQFADDRCWVLDTETEIDPAFIDWIEERLRGHPTA